MSSKATACLLGVAFDLAATHALGAPLTATIVVEASPSANDCPLAEQLTGEVEQILHRPLPSARPGEPALRVNVEFARDRDGYAARVQSLGAKPGERELRDRGPSCAPLAEAVSVALALLLDRELAPSAPEPSSAPVPVAVKPTERAAPVSEPVTPVVGSALDVRLALELGATTGLSGSSTGLLQGGAGLRFYRALTLDLLVGLESSSVTAYGSGSVRTSMVLAAARACYGFGRSIRVGPCLSFARGWLHGEGVGYPDAQSAQLRWLGAGAGVVMEGPLWARFTWLASGTAWLPLQRSSFSLENGGTAWQSARAAAALGAGLGFELW